METKLFTYTLTLIETQQWEREKLERKLERKRERKLERKLDREN